MTEKQIIEIARIKLPLVVEVLQRANLEAQKSKCDIKKLRDILNSDDFDGFYDVHDLLAAHFKMKEIAAKGAKNNG